MCSSKKSRALLGMKMNLKKGLEKMKFELKNGGFDSFEEDESSE